jgi:hypothetical protein
MNTTGELVRLLMEQRNKDGGWPYRQGKSWTEPTAFALLALESANCSGQTVDAGHDWLRRTQNGDGGWAAAPSIGESSWVTSLAVLAIPDHDLAGECGWNGLRWLVAQKSPEPDFFLRLCRWLSGDSERLNQAGGSPWVSGTSAWVVPTCITMLALQRGLRLRHDPVYQQRLESARKFLMAKRLPDGGWNHGGFFALDEKATSYPENTGLALLALAGGSDKTMDATFRKAESLALEVSSAEGYGWLAADEIAGTLIWSQLLVHRLG